MCLWADTKDPFKSRCKPLKFDEKGYVICWKIYRSYVVFEARKPLGLAQRMNCFFVQNFIKGFLLICR